MKALLAVLAGLVFLMSGVPATATVATAPPSSACGKVFMLDTTKAPDEHLHCLSTLRNQDKKLQLFTTKELGKR